MITKYAHLSSCATCFLKGIFQIVLQFLAHYDVCGGGGGTLRQAFSSVAVVKENCAIILKM
jgi:hypothetical protein